MPAPFPAPMPPAVAQAIVRRVVPDFRVTAVLPRAGGEVSAVHEVRGSDGTRPLIIKVYGERLPSASDWWQSKPAKEDFVYGILARHGIRCIPRILLREPAGTAGLPWAFAVMTRLDGRPLAEVRNRLTPTEIERIYGDMGRVLAAVHRITGVRWGYLATGLVDSRPSNAAYMLDQFATKIRRFIEVGGDPACAAAIDRHVASRASLFAGCLRPVLCHNDFHDGNVLVACGNDGWRVTGFVDVENSVVADPLLDLARTDYYALRDSAAKRQALLRGYGEPAPGCAGRAALYRLHHALEFWNWAASTGKDADLPGISADIEAVLAGDPSVQG